MLNGLIGETESLLRGVLATLSENFKDTAQDLAYTTQVVLRMLGFLVVVPSNPEAHYFELVEGIMQLMKIHQWTSDKGELLQCSIYMNIVRYLASQQ